MQRRPQNEGFRSTYLVPPARNANTIIARPWTRGTNDDTLATLQTPTNTNISTTKNSAKQGRTYFMNSELWLEDERASFRWLALPFTPFSLYLSFASILCYLRSVSTCSVKAEYPLLVHILLQLLNYSELESRMPPGLYHCF